jgi:hypothetical protein
MRNRILGPVALTAAAAMMLTGCGPAVPGTKAPENSLPQGGEQVTLDPADFSTTIDNPYWPMEPGTQWTFRETDQEGSEFSVVVTVTTDTKLIANGIEARVVRDTVYRGDEIIEDTFDWYAQDAEGAIWYLGEDTAEFENGVAVSTLGSFEAGVDGALPGIAVPADPQPGMTYRQEYYKDVAEDNGEVLSVKEMVDVIFGHFDDVLLTKDTITIEPGVLEYKLYAPGVGPVLILDIAGGSGGREELISMERVPAGVGTGPLGQPN